MDSNTELLRKVISNKFYRNADQILGKKRRDREKYLQEVAKDYINNFETLSKVYFKKVGDEYLSAEFADLISEFYMKDISNRRAQARRKNLAEALKPTNSQGSSAIVQPHLFAQANTNNTNSRSGSRAASRSKAENKTAAIFSPPSQPNESSSPNGKSAMEALSLGTALMGNAGTVVQMTTSETKVPGQNGVPPDSPLAELKTEISGLPEFIKTYIETDNEIEARKKDFLALEEKRKNILVEIQQIKNEMVRCVLIAA